MDKEEQLNRFRKVVEQSPSMFVIINPNGNIEYINDRITQILGFTREDIVGRPHVFTANDEKGLNYYKKIFEDLTGKGHFSGEIELQKKDGSITWVRASIAYIYKNNEPEFLVGSMEDITGELELKGKIRENQEMMNTIMENATVAITLLDYDGYFSYFNKLAELNLGLNPAILKSRSIVDLFPTEGPSTLAEIRQIFRDKKAVLCETSYMIEGKKKYFEINRLPLIDQNGDVYNILSISRDITEKKYRDELSKILNAIDSLQSIGETFDESLNILFDNLFQLDWVDAGGLYLVDDKKQKLEMIFHRGLSASFIKNTSVYDLESDNARIVFEKRPRYVSVESYLSSTKEDIIKEKITFVAALPLAYHNKVLGLLNLASRRFSDIDPSDRYVIEIIALKVGNLLELIKTREELDHSNEELKARLEELNVKQQLLIQKSRLESLGELSAGLAHEINQPLSIISLAIENINYKMAQRATTNEYLEKKFSTITQNIKKIRELIDHVRIFSRDQGNIMFERVNVNQVILNALSMIGSQLRHRNIYVNTELAENIGYTLGNPSRLEQVMLNLLANSRDAVEEMTEKRSTQGHAMEIRIKTFDENGRILITVRDNGTGISRENLSRVFNPFFTTKSVGSGTGLGLPIVYGIIREMKGEITADSEEGVFTEIRINLPQYDKIAENNSKL